MTRVVGLGAGGHTRTVIEILRLTGWESIVLLDRDPGLWGTTIDGAKVAGGDDLLPALVADGVANAFVGLGTTGNVGPRARLYGLVLDAGLAPVDAVHPTAVISSTSRRGRGATIAAGAVVGPGAELGDDVIVNTHAVVEHGCLVGDHVHLASGCILGGDVTVGERTHVGLGASVLQSVTIGAGTVIGAGAVVVEDVPAGVVVVGNPARALRTADA